MFFFTLQMTKNQTVDLISEEDRMVSKSKQFRTESFPDLLKPGTVSSRSSSPAALPDGIHHH